MKDYKLFDAEYKLMDLIWKEEPINSTQLVKLCEQQLGWKKSTVYTVVRKLVGRGILQNEQATVVALVKREEIQKQESEGVIEKGFGGSLPKFLTAFLGNKKLSPKEAQELKEIIDRQIKED